MGTALLSLGRWEGGPSEYSAERMGEGTACDTLPVCSRAPTGTLIYRIAPLQSHSVTILYTIRTVPTFTPRLRLSQSGTRGQGYNSQGVPIALQRGYRVN